MKKIEILESEYPGDAAWEVFFQCFPPLDEDERLKGVDDDIARVVVFKMGSVSAANRWLGRPLPALDGCTVYMILHDGRGRDIVRSLVMRLP